MILNREAREMGCLQSWAEKRLMLSLKVAESGGVNLAVLPLHVVALFLLACRLDSLPAVKR